MRERRSDVIESDAEGVMSSRDRLFGQITEVALRVFLVGP